MFLWVVVVLVHLGPSKSWMYTSQTFGRGSWTYGKWEAQSSCFTSSLGIIQRLCSIRNLKLRWIPLWISRCSILRIYQVYKKVQTPNCIIRISIVERSNVSIRPIILWKTADEPLWFETLPESIQELRAKRSRINSAYINVNVSRAHENHSLMQKGNIGRDGQSRGTVYDWTMFQIIDFSVVLKLFRS